MTPSAFSKLLLLCGLVLPLLQANAQDNTKVFLGRWDLIMQTSSGQHPSWIEVSEDHDQLKVELVGPVGDMEVIQKAHISNGELEFVSVPDPDEGRNTTTQFHARVSDGRLVGTAKGTDGTSATWTGVRAPDLKRSSEPVWGKPTSLFNGKNFDGWKFSSEKHENWIIENGVLENTGHGAEIITARKFRDFKLHIEFNCDPRSNSGIYLRGRYEVQVETDSAAEAASHHTGGVYGFLDPMPEQPRKDGVWQAFDITLVGRNLTVVQNGVTVIDHKNIPGITGGALDSQEGEPGPIYLQGSEEGKVRYRNLVITTPKE
jgi:hypothetical protein